MSKTLNLMDLSPEQLRVVAQHYYEVSRLLFDTCDSLYETCAQAGMVKVGEDDIFLNFIFFINSTEERLQTEMENFLHHTGKPN